MADTAGRGGPKKRRLPTRKGNPNHKVVDSGSNFAALRKQADLGLVAEGQLLSRETSSKRKVRDLKVNVMLLALPNGVYAIERHQERSEVSQLNQGLARKAARDL